MPCSKAKSSNEPTAEIPSLYMISNSASVNGGATLFLTTLSLVRFPDTEPSVFLMAPILLISTLTEL